MAVLRFLMISFAFLPCSSGAFAQRTIPDPSDSGSQPRLVKPDTLGKRSPSTEFGMKDRPGTDIPLQYQGITGVPAGSQRY
jgi:hypothetical protein